MKGLFLTSAVILALSGKAFHFPVYQKSDSCVGMPAKGWTPLWKCRCKASWKWEKSDTEGQGEGELKKAVLHGKKEWEGGNFASPSFLLTYQCNSSSLLLLLKGKVFLTDIARHRNWVLCSGVTPDHQSTAVTPGNCFPEPEMCTQILSLARSVGDTRTLFSTGSEGPYKDTGLCCEESSLFSALLFFSASTMKGSSERGGRVSTNLTDWRLKSVMAKHPNQWDQWVLVTLEQFIFPWITAL